MNASRSEATDKRMPDALGNKKINTRTQRLAVKPGAGTTTEGTPNMKDLKQMPKTCLTHQANKRDA